jgi:RimJ/RimL family protein N-acetyltransferase
MSEAVRGVVKELLNHHKVVIAEAFVDNAASIALLKKVNFKRVGQTKDPIVGREKLIFTAM